MIIHADIIKVLSWKVFVANLGALHRSGADALKNFGFRDAVFIKKELKIIFTLSKIYL